MGPDAYLKQGDKKILMLDDDESVFRGFQEWYYFDYVLQSGDHIIDLFAKEAGPKLPEAQRLMLADWIASNRLRLLETLSIEPGIGETMQDLLSGETLYMKDISFSYHGLRWSVFLGRTILTEGRLHFTGSGRILNPFEKPEILAIAQELWADYQKKHPQADLLEFYRDHSLDLLRAEKEIVENRNKPKTLLTTEGHLAITAKAEFDIRGDPRKIVSTLDKAEEFVFAGELESEDYPDCLHYVWLLRGSSFIKTASPDKRPINGLILSSSWTAGPGEPDFRTLGDLYLCWEELALSCLSRERLEAGKELLEKKLGGKIKHRRDHIQDLGDYRVSREWDDEMDESDELDGEGEEVNPEFEIIEEEMKERLTRRWLDTPDEHGITPRQAVQTPEGRKEIIEKIRYMEFLEDNALKSGKKPPMRLDIIRNELGL